MDRLDQSQIAIAIAALRAYLDAPADPVTGETPEAVAVERDGQRRKLIADRLGPLLQQYIEGAIPLEEFKPELDGLNKRNELWGFSGIKGQMFFNLLFNVAVDEKELDAELKAAIPLPASKEVAKSRIRNFVSYVRRIGDTFVEGGGSKHARPKVTSIPFFLSYFWQLQAPDQWAVYYTNSVRALTDLNLFQEHDDIAESYIDYQQLHEVLRTLFSDAAGKPLSLYDVEHVWSYRQKVRQSPAVAPVLAAVQVTPPKTSGALPSSSPLKLPDSYVPPIIAVIPQLAANEPALEEVAKASGTSVPRALEKYINAALTMLGYETTLLGQGAGRVQDGLAISADDSYAIMWDAKARQGGYRMGTDDRTIRDYVTIQSRELKRRRRFRNLYYVIISSGFQDDFDDLIRGLKMDTDVNEVCLLEADALVAIVDAKLRDPTQVTLGPDGLQRLFCRSGLLGDRLERGRRDSAHLGSSRVMGICSDAERKVCPGGTKGWHVIIGVVAWAPRPVGRTRQQVGVRCWSMGRVCSRSVKRSATRPAMPRPTDFPIYGDCPARHRIDELVRLLSPSLFNTQYIDARAAAKLLAASLKTYRAAVDNPRWQTSEVLRRVRTQIDGPKHFNLACAALFDLLANAEYIHGRLTNRAWIYCHRHRDEPNSPAHAYFSFLKQCPTCCQDLAIGLERRLEGAQHKPSSHHIGEITTTITALFLTLLAKAGPRPLRKV